MGNRMAIKRDFCINHPDRPAVGRCVITHVPICAECSTQYDGVNYSRQGLEILRRRRAQPGSDRWLKRNLWLVLLSLLTLPAAFEMGFCIYLLLIQLMRHR
jgi:hypothetical protein